jgi:short-subunit dehydrogenase
MPGHPGHRARPGRAGDQRGVGVGGDFAGDNELADELRLIGLNVTGAVHLAKRMLPQMIAAGSGGVLFTSSIAATAPGPYHATYPASKAFLLSLAEALRYELRDTGVTVTALMPGPTDTEFFDRAGMQGTKLREQISKDDPARVAREGFEALMAGKDHVVAGSMKNKAQVASSRVLPEAAKAATQARMTEPGSGQPGDRFTAAARAPGHQCHTPAPRRGAAAMESARPRRPRACPRSS